MKRFLLCAALLVGLATSAFGQGFPGGGSGGSGAGVSSVTTGPCLTGGPITSSGTISASTVIDPQTGTSFAIPAADACGIVFASNAATQNYTIAQATGAFSATSGFSVIIANGGPGDLVLTPAVSTINGGSSLTLHAGFSALIQPDNSGNYRVALSNLNPNIVALAGLPNTTNTLLYFNGTTLTNLSLGTNLSITGGVLNASGGGSSTPCSTGVAGLVPAGAGTVGTFLAWDCTFRTPAGGGNVTGPGSSVTSNLAGYTDTTGTVIKDSGIPAANVVQSNIAATLTGQLIGAGSVSAPIFAIDSNSGLYKAASSVPAITAGGVARCYFGNSSTYLECGAYSGQKPSFNATGIPQFQFFTNSSTVGSAAIALWQYRAGAVPPMVLCGKSNSSTIGTAAAVVSGDELCRINAFGNDGANFQDGGSIRWVATAAPVANTGTPSKVILATVNAAGTSVDAWKIDSKQHEIHQGPVPTCTTCGTGGTIVGDDHLARVTLGTTPGTIVTVGFAGSYANNPICPPAQEEVDGIPGYVTAISTTSVTFTFSSLTAGHTVEISCGGFE